MSHDEPSRDELLARLARAEARLGESEDLFATAFRSSAAAVCIVTLEGRFVEANDVFCSLTGYPREELIGRTSTELGLITPVRRERMLEELESRRAPTVPLEVLVRCKDGSQLDALVTNADIQLGGVPHRLGTLIDITERNRAAREHAQLTAQLVQAQKMESVGRLAGGVAHDFNNMLSVILGYGELTLKQLPADSPLREYVQSMLETVHRSTALTRQLLAFSRQQPAQPTVLDLNEAVTATEKLLRRVIGEDIHLTLELASTSGCVRVDPGQLEQVILNLAVNARDAMPTGGELRIGTGLVDVEPAVTDEHPGPAPGPYSTLTITDTGCGIPADVMDKLFEPFFTTKEVGKGTGLGLSIVYGIVAQADGAVLVRSQPGQGATFEVRLPQVAEQPEPSAAVTDTQDWSGGAAQLLVVEDEALLRELLGEALGGLGYAVTLAADGAEALRRIADEGLRPDLVLTDVIMPRMGGAELTEQLRARSPGIAVIYMSGYAGVDRERILRQGARIVQKPFPIRQLTALIREVLAERDAAAGGR